MKIASFNINGVKARLPLVLDWLRETAPDVAILQEILGPIPLAGWFGNGEFGPVGGVNYRHDQALCGALFYRG